MTGGSGNPGRPGPFRPGGRGKQPWTGGADAPGASWRDRIDFSRGGRRAETDGSEAPEAGPGTGTDAGAAPSESGQRADPAGSGMQPMGAGASDDTDAASGQCIIGGGSLEGGAQNEAAPPHPAKSDQTASGDSPVRVELFGRPNCHLCDEAKLVVDRVVTETGAELIEHDISLDPALEAKYGEYIPVVLVEGRQHGQWRIDAAHLERAIRAARRGRGRLFGFRRRG